MILNIQLEKAPERNVRPWRNGTIHLGTELTYKVKIEYVYDRTKPIKEIRQEVRAASIKHLTEDSPLETSPHWRVCSIWVLVKEID